MDKVYTKPLLRVLGHACLFALFIALDFVSITLDVRNVANTNFGEEGYVEWFQEIQLFVAFLFLLFSLRRNKAEQPAIIFMAGCLTVAIIREYNNFFIDYAFQGAWSMLASIAGLITLFALYKRRRNVLQSFYFFTQTQAYGIVLGGFFVTFIFSRFMGIPNFWHYVLDKNYIRDIERMAEESIELIGYTMIAFGCVQYVLTLNKISSKKA